MNTLILSAIRTLRRILGTADLEQLRAQRVADGDTAASKVAQLLLAQWYGELHRHGAPPSRFDDVEFRAFSQNGEDGILLYIFSLLGTTNRRAVEICAGDGIQCNCANLIVNHGWHAVLFDGDPNKIARGTAFYADHPDTFSFPPRLAHAWITRENVNQLVREQGFVGEIDLLSLDLDGIDYWVWEALDVVQPRVVVAEIQCIWGADSAVTVPYDPSFRTEYVNGFGIYSGASLPAFVKLAERKGYRFVGVQQLGFNAFFVRNDLCQDLFMSANPSTCLDKPFVHWAQAQFLPLVKNMPWEQV
jgi:hypothetical protein